MYTYLMMFSHLRSLSSRKSACVSVFWLGSENQSTSLDSRSKLFTGVILEDQGSPPTWRLHTKLYNFVRNISTNISTLGQPTHLKLGEVSPLFIVHNITVLLTLSTSWFLILSFIV